MSNIELNEDQQLALEQLKAFLDDSSSMCLLEGAAGTGKTTTITQFIKWVMDNHSFHEICLTSPTHKALKVMKNMCPPDVRAYVEFLTLHSLLGLKHEITKDGKEIFVRDKNIVTKFPFKQLIIVDESSMVADQLFNEMQEQNYRGTKILFVGDSNQINPVNHLIAIPMTEEKRKEFGIKHVKLTKIVRQAEDNPIIRYSQKVINDEFEFKPGTKEMKDESGIVMISDSQIGVLSKLLEYYFGSSKFDDDANYCKLVAWRNATVDFHNSFIRKFKYGQRAPKIVVNEKLIVDRPIKNENASTGFNTNEDLVVESVEVKSKKLFDGQDWKFYECSVTGDSNHGVIHVLHETEERRYSDTLRDMAKDASSTSDVGNRMKKWRAYFSFMENFAQVKYNYAITCHAAQGSTYDNCFVLYSDISFNRRDDERKRILYTALTRPKKMLYIL